MSFGRSDIWGSDVSFGGSDVSFHGLDISFGGSDVSFGRSDGSFERSDGTSGAMPTPDDATGGSTEGPIYLLLTLYQIIMK